MQTQTQPPLSKEVSRAVVLNLGGHYASRGHWSFPGVPDQIFTFQFLAVATL